MHLIILLMDMTTEHRFHLWMMAEQGQKIIRVFQIMLIQPDRTDWKGMMMQTDQGMLFRILQQSRFQLFQLQVA
jgi:hypothetical protein